MFALSQMFSVNKKQGNAKKGRNWKKKVSHPSFLQFPLYLRPAARDQRIVYGFQDLCSDLLSNLPTYIF